jgi:membrane fusion protein
MTTNNSQQPFYRPAAVAAASGNRFAGRIVLAQPVPLRVAACAAGAITVAVALLLGCGHYTRKVRVAGQLLPVAGSVRVLSPGFARLARRMVEDDEHVAVGQALFELTAERASDTRVEGLLSTRREQRAEAGRLQAEELRQRGAALDEQRRMLEAEIAMHEQEIALQGAQVLNARDKLARYRKLKGFVSASAVNDVRAELSAQQARRKSLEAGLLGVRRVLLGVQEEARGIANRSALIASQSRQDVASLEQEAAEHDGRTLVRAPVAGTVTALTLEPGQAVAAGAALATILPAGSPLEARLMVPSRARGFVEAGQQVLLRVDAYPYQQFGQVAGVVVRVDRGPSGEGDAASGPLYRVTVRLSRQSVRAYGQEKYFAAGMTLEADILQERRRLIEWLIEPLVSAAKGRAR